MQCLCSRTSCTRWGVQDLSSSQSHTAASPIRAWRQIYCILECFTQPWGKRRKTDSLYSMMPTPIIPVFIVTSLCFSTSQNDSKSLKYTYFMIKWTFNHNESVTHHNNVMNLTLIYSMPKLSVKNSSLIAHLWEYNNNTKTDETIANSVTIWWNAEWKSIHSRPARRARVKRPVI